MTAAAKPHSVWRAFAQPAAWTMLFFGFSSGLPFLLVAGTLAFWLKKSGIALADITIIASAGMAYALKFLWAPLLDHWKLPVFDRLGRRRGWLLFAQFGVVVCLLGMVWFTPENLGPFIAAALGVAFFGATQDIAVDAYRIEIAPLEAQGALVATYSLGYRLGLLTGFALAAVLADHISWRQVYMVMAAAMTIPIVANLVAREPAMRVTVPQTWAAALHLSIVDPFADFFRRYGVALATLTVLFILIFKIPEQATIGGIMSPFYLDMGFTQTQIGTITKFYGVWIGIVGTFIGGAAVARWGIWRPLLVAIVACGCSNLAYLILPIHRGDIVAFTAVISIENVTLGFLGPPTVAFLSSLVNREHTATQYSLLSSLVNITGKLLGVFAGAIVTATGYSTYFVITTLAVPPAALLWFLVHSRMNAHLGRAKSTREIIGEY
ncbi:MAG TPA: MFS transporter [Rudaea sp.]|jgi:PAT family beta-lactamase induction signal transducer AmpG|nr:MFS transporter [Rudaea sp.]